MRWGMTEQAVLCLWVNYMDGPLFYKENLWYFEFMIHRRMFAKYPGNFEGTIIRKKKNLKNKKQVHVKIFKNVKRLQRRQIYY